MKLLDVTRRGTQIFDLAQPLQSDMPCSPNHPGFRMALIRRHGDKMKADGSSGANELITTGGHVGTHIDALCHAASNGRLFGGFDARDASVGGRFNVHGIETVDPFFCRGILLDVAKSKGLERLAPGYGITANDLKEATGDLTLERGDVALVRTGWPQLYADATAYVGHESGVPGPNAEAAQWLADAGVRATGADTIAYEQIVAGNAHNIMPVHRILLTERGVHIIEVLNLEGLSAAGITEFLFVLTPLRIVGGTGSPVRPIAVVEQ